MTTHDWNPYGRRRHFITLSFPCFGPLDLGWTPLHIPPVQTRRGVFAFIRYYPSRTTTARSPDNDNNRSSQGKKGVIRKRETQKNDTIYFYHHGKNGWRWGMGTGGVCPFLQIPQTSLSCQCSQRARDAFWDQRRQSKRWIGRGMGWGMAFFY